MKNGSDKNLQLVENINEYLDETGKLTIDLYNNTGSFLIAKGSKPPGRIESMQVYTYHHNDEEDSLASNDTDSVNITKTKEEKKEILIIKYGEKSYSTYKNAAKLMEEIMDGTPLTKEKIRQVRDLVAETFTSDRCELHNILQNLRGIDDYTYNHSFSVYLLFIQAIEDLQKYKGNPMLQSVIDKHKGPIPFDEETIIQYALGALLHDYGKSRVAESILKKPGVLTSKEFEEMKKHPHYGVNELRNAGITNPNTLEIVGNHHGRYLTFPERGKTPIAIISSIIDIYDACRSERYYKQPFDFDRIKGIISDEGADLGWHPFLYSAVVEGTLTAFEESFNSSLD